MKHKFDRHAYQLFIFVDAAIGLFVGYAAYATGAPLWAAALAALFTYRFERIESWIRLQ